MESGFSWIVYILSGVQGGQALGRAHIVPLSAMQLAADAARVHGGAQQRRQLRLLAGLHAGEQAHAVQAYTGESAGALAACCEASVPQHEIALRVVGGIGHQNQMREVRVQFALREAREIEVAVQIAIDHQERICAQQRQRVRDAARGFQGLALGRVVDARTQQPITPAAEREEPVAAAYAEAANRARSLAEQLNFLRL